MGFLDRFIRKRRTGATSATTAFDNLPKDYLAFLSSHPAGDEKTFNEYPEHDPTFEGRTWWLMSRSELEKEWEMNGVGTAANYACLKLYIALQREFATSENTPSNVGNIAFCRVEKGFVIGTENGDYLYLDPTDDHSVWIYFHDGGDVLRIADSFTAFMHA